MKSRQYTDKILMIEPVAFRFNPETASNTYYQKVLEGLSAAETQERALNEFTDFVELLKSKGIDVTVVKDSVKSDTPDSIFPNNWVSFHNNGTVVLFPMFAENRRTERRPEILDQLREKGLLIREVVDMTDSENESLFLEGTGSMILDRDNRIAYAAISLRTNEQLLFDFCRQMDYRPCVFHSSQTVGKERLPIYHTNVMMCIGDHFAMICLDSIDDLEERHAIIETIEDTNKEIIEISEEQVERFAGNMLQVGSDQGIFIVMSSAAYNSLDEKQLNALEKHGTIIHSSLDTIEACGGGSARCMMAEVFLPKV
ncbi:MAG: amidinotransferase [Flavobacteriales bacterium]|nr:amidinotransferase [Flavobacteriales bacterium]